MRRAVMKPIALCAVLGSVLLSQSVDAQERRYTLVERELEYLMEVWPGNYDNREQVQHDSDAGMPDYDSGAHLRVHGQISRVDLPAFGEHVLYVEEYKDDDPSSIFRQRLYELSADDDEKAVRIKLHFFKDGAKHLQLHASGRTADDTVDAHPLVLRHAEGLFRHQNS